MSSPQEKGRKFEKEWANIFGVEPVRGSGNQWHSKMDVGDGSILWSCKHTNAKSFMLSTSLMKEAQDAITGPGGIGGSTIPGIATSVDGEVFVTLRASDFVALITGEGRNYRVPSKAEQKRARAKMTSLQREEDENDK